MGTVAEYTPYELGEHRAGTELHEDPEPGAVQLLHPGGEVHRVDQLLGQDPAVGVEVGAVDRTAGVGQHKAARLAHPGRPHVAAELRHRVGDMRRVEGRGHRQPRRAEPGLLRRCHQPVDLRRGAADHDLIRRVAVADDQPVPRGEQFGHALLVGGHRGHRSGVEAGVRGGSHRGAAGPCEREVGAAVERAGRPQRGQLTEAVPEEPLGGETEFGQVAELAHRQRADRGLRVYGLAQLGLLRLPPGVVERRRREGDPGQQPRVLELLVDLVEGRPQRRQRQHGGPARVDVLAALAGEERGDLAVLLGAAPEVHAFGVRPRVGLGAGAQLAERHLAQRGQFLLGPGHQRDPRVAGRCRAALGAGAAVQGGGQRGGVGRVPQVHRGDREHDLQVGAVTVLLHHEVEVGAAEAERGDGRAAKAQPRVADPRPQFGVDVERAVLEVDCRIGLVDVDGGRQHLVVQRERQLDHAGRAGGGLGVADLGLHAADRGVRAGVGGPADDRGERAQFGGVADRGAGAVCLEQLDTRRRAVGVVVRPVQGDHLAFLAGRVDGLEPAVAGGSQAPQNRVDLVAVPLGVGEPAQREHADALADQGAVGVLVERTDPAALGQRRGLAEAHVHEDGVLGVAAAHQHGVGAAFEQFADRGLDSAQRTGAGGVDRHVGAAQVEAVGDPAGDHVAEHAREGVLLPRGVGQAELGGDLVGVLLGEPAAADDLLEHRGLQPGGERLGELVGAGDAEDDAGARGVVPGLVGAGVLEQVAGDHQAQQLEDVGDLQRVRRQAELHGVEGHVGNEAAAPGVRLVGHRRVRVVELVDVPVGGGHVVDAVGGRGDVRPEFAQVAGLRVERGEADDGDGVTGEPTVERGFLRRVHGEPLWDLDERDLPWRYPPGATPPGAPAGGGGGGGRRGSAGGSSGGDRRVSGTVRSLRRWPPRRRGGSASCSGRQEWAGTGRGRAGPAPASRARRRPG